jgi:hypothetical protein
MTNISKNGKNSPWNFYGENTSCKVCLFITLSGMQIKSCLCRWIQKRFATFRGLLENINSKIAQFLYYVIGNQK